MWRRTFRMLVLVGGFMTLSGQALIDQSELECEEAVKRLQDCCGSDDAAVRKVSCYTERGCGGASPDFPEAKSLCWRDASCDEIRASGACQDPLGASCR